MNENKNKMYLGDSVYMDFDGYHLVLTTENGYGPSNTICIEPSMLGTITKYLDHIKDKYSKPQSEATE